MPKLYEYFGITVIFYANEHEPVHVHGKCQGRECRAEILVVDGQVVEIQFRPERGKRPLSASELRLFEELVRCNSRKNHPQTQTMNPEVFITQAKYLGGYSLELEFEDGKRQKVDFEPFLRKSLHPEIQSYLDIGKFKKFRLEHGDLVWGDFDLCFPIMDLYENQIMHTNADLMAA